MDDLDEGFVDDVLRTAGSRWRASLAEPPSADPAMFARVPTERPRPRISRASGLVAAIAVVAVAVAAIAMTSNPGGGGGQTRSGAPTAGSTSSNCAVTRPVPAFAPPPPYPPSPPPIYTRDWYGDAHLWTLLHTDGETWASLPKSDAGFGQKTFWWSTDWDPMTEPEPAITVTGRQLDGERTFSTSGHGTNASFDLGTAMLVGVDVPTTGCWELTAHFRGASLSLVVVVEE
jgi:hypothetical protein